MRKIKFRGKSIDTGEDITDIQKGDMVYGSLILSEGKAYISHIVGKDSIASVEVDPKTVGQYVGLKDQCRKEIYEGDSVKHITCCAKHKGSMKVSLVEYDGAILKPFGDQMQGDTYQHPYNYEIIK